MATHSTNNNKITTSFLTKSIYWISIISVFSSFFFFQSICLHIATKKYIGYVEELNFNTEYQLYDIIGSSITTKFDIPLYILDFLGCFPVLLYFGITLYGVSKNYDCIDIFNKTLIIASILAFLKGLLDVVTIVPDSNGWSVCKKRLNDDSIQFIKELDFSDNFLVSVEKLLQVEIFGLNNKRVRYCADMILSGHTYFALLFSLASYTSIILFCKDMSLFTKYLYKVIFVLFILTEITVVELQKFHYTVDIMIAIILVFLLWNSIFVERIAFEWSSGYKWRNVEWKQPWPVYDLLFNSDNKKHYNLASQSEYLSIQYTVYKYTEYDLAEEMCQNTP